jgi:hypothetical protein
MCEETAMRTGRRPVQSLYQGLSSREGGIRTRDLSVPNAPMAMLGGHWRCVMAVQRRDSIVDDRRQTGADVRYMCDELKRLATGQQRGSRGAGASANLSKG